MSSRSKRLVALALRQQENQDDTDSLLSQLERDPDFITKLPVIIAVNDMSPISKPSQINISIETESGEMNEILPSASNTNNIILSMEEDATFANDSIQLIDQTNNDFLSYAEAGSVAASSSADLKLDLNNYDISDDSSQESKLVPYSEHSDSDLSSDATENRPKVKRRKRCQVDKSTWLYEENRKKREKGEKYVGRKKSSDTWNKVSKPARTLKIRCKCVSKGNSLIKCSALSENDRQTIFDIFWEMTWPEKKIYLDGLIKTLPTNRHRDRVNNSVLRRACSMKYHLRKGDELVRVCKTMFLNTLCIGKWSTHNWKNARNKDIQPRKAKNVPVRPEPQSRVRPFAKENEALTNFLNSLPKMESHYCRKSTNKNYLLPEWSNKKALYNFYVSDWCKFYNVAPLSVYTFNNAMEVKNISLFHPKKDQCQICFSHKLGQVTDEVRATHIEKKKEARNEKVKDKEQEDHVFTMDLQAVLLSPRSNVSSLYYKTKLCVHNFCLFNLKTTQGTCYLWNESEGGLNAEEFATIVVKFIEDQVIPQMNLESNNKLVLYSDGCTYQNRNITMSNALLNLALTRNIIIEQKYLEVGHTQMEADSMHAMIEKQVKNRIINVPAEYVDVCRKARRNPEPYSVNYLTHEFFKSFETVGFYKSVRPGKKKGDPKVPDLRAIQYKPNGEILFKLRFGDEWDSLPQRRDTHVSPKDFNELTNLHSTRRKITKRKYEDLQELKSVIPHDYHDYYNNIPYD